METSTTPYGCPDQICLNPGSKLITVSKAISQTNLFITLIFLMAGLFFSISAFAQNGSCKSECKSNDVRVGGAYIADADGNPIKCVIDEPTSAYLYLRVYSQAPRAGMFFSANLIINDIETVLISNCFSDNLRQGANNILKIPYPIVFTCGDDLRLTNVYVAFSEQGNQCAGNSNSSCPGTTSHCREQVQAGDFIIIIDQDPEPCGLQISSPENNDLGSFTNSRPTQKTIEDYGIFISNSCGQPIILSVTDDAETACGTDKIITRTVTILDDINGNKTPDAGEETKSCTFTYTLAKDIIPPVVTSPPAVTFTSVNGSYPTTENTGNASATDNFAAVANIAMSYKDAVVCNANSATYTINRTFTATDECGNASSSAQVITVTRAVTAGCFSASLFSRTFAPGANGKPGRTTFTYDVCANGCLSSLSHIAFITPANIRLLSLQDASTYQTEKYTYKVSIPVASNVFGVKYDLTSQGEGIQGSRSEECERFTFTLEGNVPADAITVHFKGGSAPGQNATAACPERATPGSIASQATIFDNSAVEKNVIAKELTIKAFPNPYQDKVRFTVNSPVTGQGTLEVFNVLGQKVKTVHQGTFVAGPQTFELNVPSGQRSTLIYKLTVGSTQLTGKLLSAKQ